MSIVMTARDVPEVRARMASWARDPNTDGAANWFTFWLGPHPEQATESRVFDLVDNVVATISSTLAAQLPAAELFYVSDDMTELAGHAATTATWNPLRSCRVSSLVTYRSCVACGFSVVSP